MNPFVDRVPANPGRILITPEDGTEPFYAVIERADKPVVEGTLLNAEVLNKLAVKEDVNTTNTQLSDRITTAQNTADSATQKANNAQSTADSATQKANTALGRQNIKMSVSNGILYISW